MQNPQNEECDIACNFGAIAPDERMPHASLAEEIFQAILEIKEMPDGYSFRLPPETLLKTSEWINKERLCCPFFSFRLDIAQEFWLSICGNEEVKSYIAEIIVKPLQETGQLPDKEQWIADHS
jgi:hypothetical protein